MPPKRGKKGGKAQEFSLEDMAELQQMAKNDPELRQMLAEDEKLFCGAIAGGTKGRGGKRAPKKPHPPSEPSTDDDDDFLDVDDEEEEEDELPVLPEDCKYEILGKLGEGVFGAVFKARIRGTVDEVAVKQVKFESATLSRDTIREAAILHAVKDFPLAVQFKELIRVQDNVFIVMSAHEMPLDEVDSMDMTEIRVALFQMLLFLKYFHARGFVHRDIKPDNILISERGTIAVADFGKAIDVRHGVPLPEGYSRDYRPPEVILGDKSVTCNGDVWSTGCVLFCMLVDDHLFNTKNRRHLLTCIAQLLRHPSLDEWPEMATFHRYERWKALIHGEQVAPYVRNNRIVQKVLRRGDFRDADKYVWEDDGRKWAAAALLKRMLCVHPEKRPTPGETLEDPFFTPIWSKIQQQKKKIVEHSQKKAKPKPKGKKGKGGGGGGGTDFELEEPWKSIHATLKLIKTEEANKEEKAWKRSKDCNGFRWANIKSRSKHFTGINDSLCKILVRAQVRFPLPWSIILQAQHQLHLYLSTAFAQSQQQQQQQQAGKGKRKSKGSKKPEKDVEQSEGDILDEELTEPCDYNELVATCLMMCVKLYMDEYRDIEDDEEEVSMCDDGEGLVDEWVAEEEDEEEKQEKEETDEKNKETKDKPDTKESDAEKDLLEQPAEDEDEPVTPRITEAEAKADAEGWDTEDDWETESSVSSDDTSYDSQNDNEAAFDDITTDLNISLSAIMTWEIRMLTLVGFPITANATLLHRLGVLFGTPYPQYEHGTPDSTLQVERKSQLQEQIMKSQEELNRILDECEPKPQDGGEEQTGKEDKQSEEGHEKAPEDFASPEVRAQIADLKASIAELRHELKALSVVPSRHATNTPHVPYEVLYLALLTYMNTDLISQPVEALATGLHVLYKEMQEPGTTKDDNNQKLKGLCKALLVSHQAFQNEGLATALCSGDTIKRVEEFLAKHQ